MRIYIAYKYSKIKDKEKLKSELLKVSDILEEFGHSTFMLGRDVQNWDNTVHPIHSKLAKMQREIRNAEGFFAYINSNSISPGLFIEIHIAKLFGKKIIIAAKEGIKTPYFSLLASKTIPFSDFDDLRNKLE